jgi:hypothetical protein
MINNIIFKYYFKENSSVHKCCVKYNDLINVLELINTKDSKGNLYNEGYTYQLQQLQNTLLNNKDLNIFKCDVYVDNQVIL